MIDETGDLKKGTTTVGVQRQYTGTAGRVENAQVAVYLVYASQAGHAMIDRELYVPRGWIDDPDRCRAAGIPEQVGFATKPHPATRMLARALDAGVPAAWVTGDEVYGADPALGAELQARGVGYVLAVACDHPVRIGGATQRADTQLGRVSARAWQCVSAGKGAKGHRLYEWAFIRLDDDPQHRGQAAQHWLLIRRNHKTGELAFYHCWMPRPVPLAMLVRVAGRRWTIEERASRPARAWSAWTSIRSAAGAPGIAGQPGDVDPRLPGGGGRDRTDPPPTAVGADRVEL